MGVREVSARHFGRQFASLESDVIARLGWMPNIREARASLLLCSVDLGVRQHSVQVGSEHEERRSHAGRVTMRRQKIDSTEHSALDPIQRELGLTQKPTNRWLRIMVNDGLIERQASAPGNADAVYRLVERQIS